MEVHSFLVIFILLQSQKNKISVSLYLEFAL